MTPTELAIGQLLILFEAGGPRVVAKSDGVPFALEDAALQAAVRFGRPPAGVACPLALFAMPMNRATFAVAHVAQLAGPQKPELGFHFLFLGRRLYEAIGDPFLVSDFAPPDWSARGALPVLAWPNRPLEPRRVEDLQAILKARPGPFLLGSAQALVDGSRVAIQRTEPATELIRNLWQFLPTRTRFELTLTTMCFSEELTFQVQVAAKLPEKLPFGYLSEDAAGSYPAGKYELGLQIAIEDGNQAELERLLGRQSSADMLRLSLQMLAVVSVLAIIGRVFLR